MSDMDTIFSREYNEEICYYPDDIYYSFTIMGVGLLSGHEYKLTFDEDDNLVEIEEA